jgi:hypothetical protein
MARPGATHLKMQLPSLYFVIEDSKHTPIKFGLGQGMLEHWNVDYFKLRVSDFILRISNLYLFFLGPDSFYRF